MLNFPRWKTIFVLLVTLFFVLAALPNVVSPQTRASFPGWMKNAIPLGLDLRGGSHLLLQLDFDRYLREHVANTRDGLRKELRAAKIGYTQLLAGGQEISLRVRDDTVADGVNLRDVIRKADPDLSIEDAENGALRIFYSDATQKNLQSRLLQQSIEIVTRRIDESGTKEPIIQRQGLDRIVVQVPGLADPSELKRLLGKTASMSFHLVNETVAEENILRGVVPAGTRILSADEGGDPTARNGYPQKYAVYSSVALSGELLTNAHATYQDGAPVVSFTFNRLGAQKFGSITQANIGKRFAVVLDSKVITAPVIRGAILGGSGIIEGNFTVESANELATLLRAGALPAPLDIIEERTVGPSLGQDSIDAGTMASIVGIGCVIIFMLLGYGLFGVFANISLVVHLIIIVGVMSLIQATLTLPGIAGIVLTMGMAVDANVLIFERMRDEIRFGKSPLGAIEHGFSLAWGTIVDSNITTLMAAALLYTLGAGSVKGFAVTLTIGILSTMFASVMVCRMLIYLWAKRARPKTLPI